MREAAHTYLSLIMGPLKAIGTRWNEYIQLSINRQIAGSALVTAISSLGARFAGFFKEAAVAAVFGVSGDIDVYVVAFTLIGIPSSILLNALQSALIPAVARVDADGNKSSSRILLAATSSLTLLGMTLFLLALIALLPWIVDHVGHGFTAEKKARVIELLYWFIPYYFLSALNLLGYGALQARKRFLHNGLIPVLVPLGIIVLLVLVQKQVGIMVLIWGLLLGTLLEHVTLNIYLHRLTGMTLVPGRMVLSGQILPMLSQSAFLLPGTLVMAFWPVIDQTLASGLGEGAIAALNYGFKIPAVVSGLAVTAIGVAVLPYFSEMLARRDWQQCLHALNRFTKLLLIVGVSSTLILIMSSGWLVEFVFQRGAFGSDATKVVVPIQQAYLLQLPGSLVGMLAVRMHIALGRNRALGAVTIVSVVLYAFLAWLLVRWMGVVGIALATSIIAAASATALLYLSRMYLKRMSMNT